MEYQLCGGNWTRAFELACALGTDDEIADPLLRPLARLSKPALGAERAGRNQPCLCGSGRKYKMCCRAKDLEGGMHPLPDRASALYAMIASYAKRGSNRRIVDRMSACVIGAPQAAMLALDLAIFDGGIAERFLSLRGHLLRPDEGQLLSDWLTRPADMYEVSWVKRSSELGLRSLGGGPQRLRQRDRLFSVSVRRLDIVVGRLLPGGERLPDGSLYLRVLGGMAILHRDMRQDAQELFRGGPVAPGADPAFGVRLLGQFGQRPETVFQTADGEGYRWCETTINVDSPARVWERLTEPCLLPPEPPIQDLRGYNAYLAEVPSRFWTRTADDQIEYVGKIQPGRLTNLGTITRKPGGLLVTANSVSRAAELEAAVVDAAATAGRSAAVATRSSRTTHEMAGETRLPDERPDSREAMCRRLGVDTALTAVEPRTLILEGYFLPLDHSVGEAVARELNRDLGIRSMLESTHDEGMTPADAVAVGGAARERVLAMIDDCEWRLARAEAEGKDTSFMPHPDELRRRLGLANGRR
jgi:hypothetical protein